jgi:hypothetical protein
VDVGWWDDPDECMFQKLQLVSTEIAEATEGARKSCMDTHLTHRAMEEVEYADAMIRTLDLGGKLALKFEDDAEPHPWCIPTNSVGRQHLGINASIIEFATSLFEYEVFIPRHVYFVVLGKMYSDLIVSIVTVSNNRGYKLYGAIDEKLEYNKTRADHKRENREKEHGKKF